MSGSTEKEQETKPVTNKKRASQALYVPISLRKKLERFVFLKWKYIIETYHQICVFEYGPYYGRAPTVGLVRYGLHMIWSLSILSISY